MDRFTTLLQEQFDASVAESFVKKACYYPTMDQLEYVSRDTITTSDRVDEFLTLFLEAGSNELIGFRLKGFGYVFNKYVKRLMKLSDEDFNPLVEALECAFTQMGQDMFPDVDPDDERRIKAYRSTKQMIKQDELELPAEFQMVA